MPPRSKAPKSANDKPSIALIGCGGRGRSDAKDASKFGNIVAVCDVDRHHAEGAALDFVGGQALPRFPRAAGSRRHSHRRQWHAGPLAHAGQSSRPSQGEGRLRRKAPHPDDRRGQTMSSKRSRKPNRISRREPSSAATPTSGSPASLSATAGIGKLKEVDGHLSRPVCGAAPSQVQPVPEHFDCDFWLGQAPKVDYVPQRTPQPISATGMTTPAEP